MISREWQSRRTEKIAKKNLQEPATILRGRERPVAVKKRSGLRKKNTGNPYLLDFDEKKVRKYLQSKKKCVTLHSEK